MTVLTTKLCNLQVLSARGVEVRILGPHGAEAPVGSAGEISVRGDVVTRCYRRNDKANAVGFSKDFLRTRNTGLIGARDRLRLSIFVTT